MIPGIGLLLLADKPFVSAASLSVIAGIILTLTAFAAPSYVQTLGIPTNSDLPGAAQALALPLSAFP